MVIFVAAGKASSLVCNIQTGYGAHPVSYLMGNGGFSPTVEWAGHKVDHSHPSTAEVKNEWSYISKPQLHLHTKDLFTFYHKIHQHLLH
jgi:hypothetical protein